MFTRFIDPSPWVDCHSEANHLSNTSIDIYFISPRIAKLNCIRLRSCRCLTSNFMFKIFTAYDLARLGYGDRDGRIPVNPGHLTSWKLIGAHNQTPLHNAQGWNQAQSEELRLKSSVITLAHVDSGRAQECSRVLSHSSRCLLIAHVAPLCNSSSNPEKALCEGRFHAIIYRDFYKKHATT
jgi:hypothetical protein